MSARRLMVRVGRGGRGVDIVVGRGGRGVDIVVGRGGRGVVGNLVGDLALTAVIIEGEPRSLTNFDHGGDLLVVMGELLPVAAGEDQLNGLANLDQRATRLPATAKPLKLGLGRSDDALGQNEALGGVSLEELQALLVMLVLRHVSSVGLVLSVADIALGISQLLLELVLDLLGLVFSLLGRGDSGVVLRRGLGLGSDESAHFAIVSLDRGLDGSEDASGNNGAGATGHDLLELVQEPVVLDDVGAFLGDDDLGLSDAVIVAPDARPPLPEGLAHLELVGVEHALI